MLVFWVCEEADRARFAAFDAGECGDCRFRISLDCTAENLGYFLGFEFHVPVKSVIVKIVCKESTFVRINEIIMLFLCYSEIFRTFVP